MPKCNGSVFAKIVPKCSKATLPGIIRDRVVFDSAIYSAGWCGHNGLVDVSYGEHIRINHGGDEFVQGQIRINEIDGFVCFG